VTIANDIIFLSLRNAAVTGVGQTPLAEDVNDSFRVLNAMIGMWNIGRGVTVNLRVLPTFPDLTTDVPFWTPTSMCCSRRWRCGCAKSTRSRRSSSTSSSRWRRSRRSTPSTCNRSRRSFPACRPRVQQILVLALRMAGRINDKQSIGIGSADMNDAFSLLVAMMAQWRRSPWLAWVNAELIIPSTGAQSYPMLDRPPRLASAFARLLTTQQVGGINNAGPMDYPLPSSAARANTTTSASSSSARSRRRSGISRIIRARRSTSGRSRPRTSSACTSSTRCRCRPTRPDRPAGPAAGIHVGARREPRGAARGADDGQGSAALAEDAGGLDAGHGAVLQRPRQQPGGAGAGDAVAEGSGGISGAVGRIRASSCSTAACRCWGEHMTDQLYPFEPGDTF
jgi:hypothetical protein